MQTGQRIGTSVGIAVITAIVFAVRPYSSWSVAVNCWFTGDCFRYFVSLSYGL